MFRSGSDKTNQSRNLQESYSRMTNSEKKELNRELKEDEVNERMNGQFNGLSNTIIMNGRNQQNIEQFIGNSTQNRDSSNSHHFNLVRADNLYARDRGLEFFCLALLFCTSGQVMDQLDNIGASILMTRFDLSISQAAF